MHDHQVAVSANGKKIYINLTQRPASDAIARNPNLLSLIKEILEGCKLDGETVELEYDMKRPVGFSESVDTKDDDLVFYAKQTKTSAYTRFIKNRKTVATTIVSMQLKRSDSDSYLVSNVRIGKAPVPLPGSPDETSQSQEYWEKHAVVYNGQSLISSSITKSSPYEDDSATS